MKAPVTLSLALADGELADRLVELLAPLPDVRLVGSGEPADAIVTAAASALGPFGGETNAAAGDAPTERADDTSTDAVDDVLTPRESEVLAILAEGASNGEIATRLGISVHTAKFHVRSLYEKLEASGRVDAVAHAARRGIIRL